MDAATATRTVFERKSHDFSQSPMLVYWEVTQACGLACAHCRASAKPEPHPLELNHEEGKRLLQSISRFGEQVPHLVFTGGDPLLRSDLFELIKYARELGIHCSITPSATPALTREAIVKLIDSGIETMALSLDGSSAERHDKIRNIPGTFDRTVEAAKWAKEMGIPLQINTLVAEETEDDLQAIYDLVATFGIVRWSLFFLISVGRGRQLNEVSPSRGEDLMKWVLDLAQHSPFLVKTTEAPSYRRVIMQNTESSDKEDRSAAYRAFGIRDGNGIVFVSHLGSVYPSGFLPVAAGNVRKEDLVNIYRNAPLFESLRHPDQFAGKCGECEYRMMCGGSRARAYGHTGDPLASDPLCLYEPAGLQPAMRPS